MSKLEIYVKPGSKKGPLVETGEDGVLTIFVRERAVDGKANEAVVEVVAEHLGVPKSRLKIIRGHTSRHKTVQATE
jgi:uncharacterized protein YggU (UPF0235/DUF167 family)